MKEYEFTSEGTTVSFKVNKDWLKNVKIKATGDPAEQIYKAAMSDPEESGIIKNWVTIVRDPLTPARSNSEKSNIESSRFNRFLFDALSAAGRRVGRN